MFTYNTTPHTATGYTPFELVYGHQADLPTALTKPYLPNLHIITRTTRKRELKERLRATNQLAKKHVKDEKIKAKLQYDKKAREITFKVGQSINIRRDAMTRTV